MPKTKITPEFVLQRINEARIKEELAIPIYASHIKQTMFWSGISEDKQEKIIASLKVLESDSMKHSKMLKVVYNNFLKYSK
ncbi:MAG: hypothetical protein NT165_00255 [Candidatus Falkowbacteria bacterium]|nr:hypothetical protein [Candidatus Falkowbacteria bacterium]